MLVATIHHLGLPPGSANAGWAGASHAFQLLVVYLALVFLGPGKYSVAPKWR
jgi:putative oxidoreductase